MNEAVQYLARFNPRLLAEPEGRRVLSRLDPKLFSILYLRHHLRGPATGDEISFSEFHDEMCSDALKWLRKPQAPRESRTAYVAPRDCGKSTWNFLILPLWAAAHGHVKFAAAFADSATQAEQHLQTFRHELATNALLRRDFPKLCRAATKGDAAIKLSDNRAMIRQANGFIFSAKGIDAGNLGMKVGELRPDLIILDDIEPGEANYSAGQAEKRLGTVTDVVLPLNEYAKVVLVGTVTMPGSIVHQLVRTITTNEPPEDWINDENFVCRYFPAIVDNGDGTERSIWPQKWTLEFLQSIRHTRSFLKNFQNDPMAVDGAYWTRDDFIYGELEGVTQTLLSIDPAVTSKDTSDWTGIAVVGRSPAVGKCIVRHAEAVKMSPGDLRKHVLKLLERFPEIRLVYIETNQGGDTWAEILHDLPVPLKTVHQSAPKHVRAAEALNHYNRKYVLHERQFVKAEEQMVGFPKAPYDDIVDAVGTAVNFLLDVPATKKKAGAKAAAYT